MPANTTWLTTLIGFATNLGDKCVALVMINDDMYSLKLVIIPVIALAKLVEVILMSVNST